MTLKATSLLCWISILFWLGCAIPSDESTRFIAPHPVINELMMNPGGSSLPANEWLELYNPSDVAILLKNYTLSYNNRSFEFPDIYLPARQYIIVTASQNEGRFTPFGNVCGIPGWPTMSNTGATLTLSHLQVGTVDQVSYSSSWYSSTVKRRGGWSLERINPEFGCNPVQAWQESEALDGGTPGRQNSVYRLGVIPSLQIAQTIIQTNDLYFVLNIDVESMLSIHTIQMANDLPRPVRWTVSRDTIHFFFDQALPVGTPYVVTLMGKFCGGEVTLSHTVFAETILMYNDVVINEVLFNPYTGSPSFVEIYNRSDKIINLQHWRLGNRVISNQQLLFPPKSYRVITTNREQLQRDYPSANLDNVLVLPSLPAYANLQGIVTVFAQDQLMDSLRYTAEMHQPFTRNARGVSLERISSDTPTNDPGNFISASTYSEGATPGYENSRNRAGTIAQDKVYLAARTINPNSIGEDRQLIVYYEFTQENTMVNLTIYDDKGRRINRLVRNRGVGYTGQFIWDGTGEAGQSAAPGIYLMWMETYHEKGSGQTFKETFLLRN